MSGKYVKPFIIHWIHGVERKQSISYGLACGTLVAVEIWSLLQFDHSNKLILAQNLARMSPIFCHCRSPGDVWEACQTIHWIRGVERKQSISYGLACGDIGGC